MAAEKVLDSVNNFERLYRNFPKECNVAFSPFGVCVLFAILQEGTTDETKSALRKLLQLNDSSEAVNSYLNILNELDEIKDVKILNATEIFKEITCNIKQEIITTLKNKLKCDIETLNFAHHSVSTIINSWVKEIMDGKISSNVIEAADLNDQSKLVLVHTMYLKNSFKKEFRCDDLPLDFYIDKEKTIEVPAIGHVGTYRYQSNEELGAVIVEIPFRNEKLSMIIVSPSYFDNFEFKELEKKLSQMTLKEVTKYLEYSFIEIRIPKFKLECTVNIKEAFSKLGNEEATKLGFDFSNSVTVDKIIQKVCIEVDEEGIPYVPPDKNDPNRCVCRVIRDRLYANGPFMVYVQLNGDNPQTILQARVVNPLK